MDNHEFKEWYKRVENIITEIEIPWELHLLEDKIFQDPFGNGRLYVQIQFNDMNNVDGESCYRAYCRKWYLSPYMTTQEVVRTAWLAYRGAVMHEAQEKFRYRGRMIFGPHVDPQALVEIAHRREVRPNHLREYREV